MEFHKYFFSLYKPAILAKYVEKVGEHVASMETEEIRTAFLSANSKATEHCGAIVWKGS
jgi:hypothetical protein